MIVSNEICNHIWEMIKCKSQKAILEKGIFYIGFSGGSLPKIMAKADMCTGIEFDKWRVFFTDERLVPNDHNDSNFKNCNDALFSKVYGNYVCNVCMEMVAGDSCTTCVSD